MSNEVKIYKNRARENPITTIPYTPQYQQRGIEPEEVKSTLVTDYVSTPIPPSMDNPRAPRAVIRQPYAEASPSPIGRGKGPVPNVGNNLEHTWSSVDGEIVDDISEEMSQDQPMIDNNDFVTAAAFGISEQEILPVLDEIINPQPKKFMTQNELQEVVDSNQSMLLSLKENDYLLLIDGVEIYSGLLEDVQKQVRDLLFGDHESYNDDPISIDDILVIKRVKINVGVFLE